MTWANHKPSGGSGQGPPSGIPAKGYRPPFTSGNLAPLTHGARSPRVYGDLAQRLAAGLTEDRPDLGAYPETVAAWATAEAQAALLRRHVAEVGPLDTDTGKPREAVLTWLTRLEGAAARHRATLGLDPRSEAALSRERAAASVLAVDLDVLAERGRLALAARSTVPPDLAGEVLGVQVAAYAGEREAAS
jgi:hypothetical protein